MPKFIGEPITVIYKTPLQREKTPTCPDGFIWSGEEFTIERSMEEWVDYTRKGRYERNMRDSHLAAAMEKGSFGVGRFSFRVRVTSGRSFEIYFDRAPTKNNKIGSWVLYKELDQEDGA